MPFESPFGHLAFGSGTRVSHRREEPTYYVGRAGREERRRQAEFERERRRTEREADRAMRRERRQERRAARHARVGAPEELGAVHTGIQTAIGVMAVVALTVALAQMASGDRVR